MTRIAVIGGGNIGGTIGDAWRRAGHEVVHASRSPQPPRTVAIADAVAGAEVVLLAVPGAAVPDLLAEHGPALGGRVVIDATNDVGAERLHHADVYAELAHEMFANPTVGGEVADLFWCGPDDAGVEQLIADVGLRPVRVGGIDAIDVVDGAARLWLTLVFRQRHPRRLALRILAD